MADPAPQTPRTQRAAWVQEWTVELSFTDARVADDAAEMTLGGFRARYSEQTRELYTRVDATTADGAAALARAVGIVTEQLATPGTLNEARVVRKTVEMRRALRGYRGRLATLTDAAKLMEVSEPRARAILDSPDAPEPLDITSAGPIWNSAEVLFYRLQHLLTPRTRDTDPPW